MWRAINQRKETTVMMKAKRATLSALLAAATLGLAGAAFAEVPSATNDEWRNMVTQLSQRMADRDGMVSRQAFLAEMGRRFDRLDAGKRGVLDMRSIEEILAELAMR